MQNHTGTSSLSETVFFTPEVEGTHVYQVSGYLTVTGTGDGVNFNFKRNGTSLGGASGEQGDYTFFSTNVILSSGDELSLTVGVTGTFSWQLQLRLIRILDELAPLE
jgi:hypothetical protein